MFDASILEGCTYQLLDIKDHQGGSKLEGSRSDQEKYQYWVGCFTNDIRIVTREHAGNAWECLMVQFVADADGNYVDRHLRTSPIVKLETQTGHVTIHTVNSVYQFGESALPEPEIRRESNLLELWLGTGDHRFGKGVHYDADGTPHVLSLMVHLGTMRDSFLICHRDNPCITVARYFKGYQRVELYDTLYRQQDYSIPMCIHNTSNKPLTIEFQFSHEEYVIEPGGELLIYPPKRFDRRGEL